MAGWLFKPLSLWIAGVVLFISVCGLEVERNPRSLLWHIGAHTRGTRCYFPRYVFALHTEAGWRLYDEVDLERDREAARRIEDPASRVITMDYYARSWRMGLVGCTEEHVVQRISMWPGFVYNTGAAMTTDEAASVRAALVDHLMAEGRRVPPRDELRHEDIDESRPLWFGWVHNAALALSLSITGAAFIRWLPTAVRLGREPPPGHCKRCGYNLAGLPEPRCPECGTITSP